MKKLISLFMALVMCLSLCACGGQTAPDTNSTIDNALQGTWKQITTETIDLSTEFSGSGAISASVATELVFHEGTVILTSSLYTVDVGFGTQSIGGAAATGTYKIEDSSISLTWDEKAVAYDDFTSLVPDSLSYKYEGNKLSLASEGLTALEFTGLGGSGEDLNLEFVRETLISRGWYISVTIPTYYTSINYFFQDDGYVVATYNYREKSSTVEAPLVTFIGTYTINTDSVEIDWISVDPANAADSFSASNELWFYCENGDVSLSYVGIPMKNFEC